MAGQLTRRRFLERSVLAGTAAATAWYVNPRPALASKSSLEKLNLAAIGTGNRAAANIQGCASQNLVALADVDANFLDAAATTYSGARKYRDFRVMLEKEAEKIDGVIVATPDHTHAPAAAMAMRMGKHTYCEKPLTHTVYEARKLAELAAQNNLVTQMGNQIHAGDNYRRVVEIVESGTIGPVREVHVWVSVDYSGAVLTTGHAKPEHVDWDLWLGPAPKREYVESRISGEAQTVHPFHWRWFWDYGNGGLGDFGCHYMDLAHWALKLKHPTRISATGPEPQAEAATSGIVVNYDYAARGELPPVKMTWYDGGKRPEILSTYEIKDEQGKPIDWNSGQLFIGEKGALISNYGTHQLLPQEKAAALTVPEPYLASSIGHHNEWIEAIKSGGATTCNFDYAGALTEAVLLAVASYRSGETIEWDAKNFKTLNSPRAQQLLHREYRKGWTL
ncbi:MAG: Gfo/Idh/MocA family oxidoreductase [Planctomycetales bacterium]|nr:Gfo/Idh/MocA family oxidoreductase [Planctomycetales bacterium]